VCGCGDAKEASKRFGDLELVIGAGEVGFRGVGVIIVDDVGSKMWHIIHSERWGGVETSVDTLAVENQPEHTCGLRSNEVLVEDALAERSCGVFEDTSG
jgi:hypothetical protein